MSFNLQLFILQIFKPTEELQEQIMQTVDPFSRANILPHFPPSLPSFRSLSLTLPSVCVYKIIHCRHSLLFAEQSLTIQFSDAGSSRLRKYYHLIFDPRQIPPVVPKMSFTGAPSQSRITCLLAYRFSHLSSVTIFLAFWGGKVSPWYVLSQWTFLIIPSELDSGQIFWQTFYQGDAVTSQCISRTPFVVCTHHTYW